MNKKGISLAVLVVTIIVLVILTAATVSTISGQNGVIEEARDAANESGASNARDKIEMELAGYKIKAARTGSTVAELAQADTANLQSKGIAATIGSDNLQFIVDGKYQVNATLAGKLLNVTDTTGKTWFASTTVDAAGNEFTSAAGAWQIVATPNINTNINTNINFTYGSGKSAVAFSVNSTNISYTTSTGASSTSFELCYVPAWGWDEDSFRNVNFATAPTGALLEWLCANAIKQ